MLFLPQRKAIYMPGYQDDFSKSNNAVAAEASGRFPATVLARRLGVEPGAIRALLRPCEWHHTSKMFNCTDYFDESEAVEMIDELRAWKAPAAEALTWWGCSGVYLEWSGTRSHPQCKEIVFGPVRATRKGQWFILELPWGPMRKKATTRGFKIRDGQGRRLN